MQTEFPLFKTVKVRKHLRSADEARGIITVAGGKVSDWAKGMLNNVPFTGAYVDQEFDLVAVSGRDLGFTQNVTRREIYDRAIERGLERCTAELAIWISEQYQDQPMSEWLLVGMDPLAGSDGSLGVFGVVPFDGGLWLHGGYGHSDNTWDPDDRWVFMQPRK